MTSTNPVVPIARGDVWDVNFDPSEGDEIQKKRPAVVINQEAVVISREGIGRLRLVIVVPITGWNPRYADYFWMVMIPTTARNGLTKDSAADAFQVKSVSQQRLVRRRGELTPLQLDDIAAAIALCVGYAP